MATTNINDIYTNAEKQKKANAEATQILKDAKAAQIQEDNALLEKRAAAAKDKTRAEYNEIYDTNAVNQYISEQRVAESMANAGLTKSGLNATQMTAIQTSRGNADNRARLQEQAAINDIELQLTEGIAQNQRSLREYEAQQDAQLKVDNAAVDTQATKDANQWVNDYNQSIKDAAAERDTQIKAATAAIKNLDASSAISQIKYYADIYGLDETEVRTMCANAGIDYSSYKNMTPTKDDFKSYLTSYKVTETGRASLLGYLKGQKIITDKDAECVEKLYSGYLKGKNADAISSASASKQVDDWLSQGVISENAANYMKALLEHHGFEYIKSQYSGTEYEQAKSAVMESPHLVASYKTFADSFKEQFHNKDKDHNETLNLMQEYGLLTPEDIKFINEVYIGFYPPQNTMAYKNSMSKLLLMHYNRRDISENAKTFMYALYDI